ncbi:MAG: winged helix-turn-helix transcriptional regulator [archaeon]|nr:winged helix-turn-helix transcriptional regulator [archaeon]
MRYAKKSISIIKILTIFLLVGSLLPFISGESEVIVHIDETGNSLFLGSSSEDITKFLPEGVKLENGRIIGETILQTSKSEEVWTFSFYLNASEIKVFLPKNSIVKETNGEVYISNGKVTVYNLNNITISYVIEKNNKTNFTLTAIILAILLLFGSAFYYYKNHYEKKRKTIPKKKEKNKIEIIQEILSEKENLIIETLKEKGKIKSSHLRKLTGISKSSFFRHIQELEKKGLVKRTGEGRNKFVGLSK